MYKNIIAVVALIALTGCPDEEKNIIETNDTGVWDMEGLPEGTECNQGGTCIYECSGEECKTGVDLDGGVMTSATCCHYDSGDNLVCEPVGWYERLSDGFIVADCNDDICRLTFTI